MADDCIPASPVIRKLRKQRKIRSKRASKIRNKNSISKNETLDQEDCLEGSSFLDDTEISIKETPPCDQRGEQLLLASDSDDQQLFENIDVLEGARLLERGNDVVQYVPKCSSHIPKNQGFIPLSQMVSDSECFQEEMIDAETKSENNSFSKIIDTEMMLEFSKSQPFELDGATNTTENVSISNQIKHDSDKNQKGESNIGNELDHSAVEAIFMDCDEFTQMTSISGSPEQKTEDSHEKNEHPPENREKTDILGTYSRRTAEKRKRKDFERKLEDHFSADSYSSFDSDLSLQNNTVLDAAINSDRLDLNKSSRVCENIINLSSFFSQAFSQENESNKTTDEIYDFIMRLKSQRPSFMMIDWFRLGKNFKISESITSEDFCGFSQQSVDYRSSCASSVASNDSFLHEYNALCGETAIKSEYYPQTQVVLERFDRAFGTPKLEDTNEKEWDPGESIAESAQVLQKRSLKRCRKDAFKEDPKPPQSFTDQRSRFSNDVIGTNGHSILKKTDVTETNGNKRVRETRSNSFAERRTVNRQEEQRRRTSLNAKVNVTGIQNSDDISYEKSVRNLDMHEEITFESKGKGIGNSPSRKSLNGDYKFEDKINDDARDKRLVRRSTRLAAKSSTAKDDSFSSTPESRTKMKKAKDNFSDRKTKQTPESVRKSRKEEEEVLNRLLNNPICVDNQMILEKDQHIKDDCLNHFEPLVDDNQNERSSSFSLTKKPEQTLNMGFTLASGANVKISEQAMTRAKQILTEEVNDTITTKICEAKCSSTINDFQPGFKLASGQNVNISNESLKIARNLICDEDDLDDLLLSNLVTEFHEENPTFVRNSLDVECTEIPNKLSKSSHTKSPYKNLKTKTATQTKDSRLMAESSIQHGFKLASGSSIKISHEAMERAQMVLNDERDSVNSNILADTVSDYILPRKKYPKIEVGLLEERNQKVAQHLQVGFNLASGSNVKISNNALEKAKMLLNEEMNNTKDDNFTNTSTVHKGDEGCLKQNLQVGFKLASGSTLKISDQALKKARVVLTDVMESIADDNFTVSSMDYDNQQKTCSKLDEVNFTNISGGFKLASGSNVKISKTAMERAKLILAEEAEIKQEENCFRLEDINGTTEQNMQLGFKLASGSNVTISDKAMEIAKTVLTEVMDSAKFECDKFKDEIQSEQTIVPTEGMKGFQTGRGNEIKISEKAFQEAERILCDNDNEPDENKSEMLSVDNKRKRRKDVYPLRETNISHDGKGKLSSKSKSMEPFTPENLNNSNRPTRRSIRRLGSGLLKSRLSLSRSKFKTPTAVDTHSTPNKPIVHEDRLLQSPNIGEFFKSVNTSTPKALKDESNSCTLTQEICESTAALLEDEFKDNFVNDFKEIDWNSFGENSKPPDVEATNKGLRNFIKDARSTSRKLQLQRIRTKGNRDIPVSPGYLWREKSKKNGTSLKDFVKDKKPNASHNCDLQPANCNYNNAKDVKFSVNLFYPGEIDTIEGVVIGDGAKVIPDSDNYIGFEEIKNAFLEMNSVAPKLVEQKWIMHHFRMIASRLANMERQFPFEFKNVCSPENVILHLKYRYDREVDLSHRSAIRKILEKDDAPTKRMVLCVQEIRNANSEEFMVLSDGWYNIRALIDTEMINYISMGKVAVGTKLMIQNAELLNCDTGCSPLELPESARLKIHTNSTKRCVWHTKMGFYRVLKPFTIKLDDVKPNGGLISRLVLCIVRTYPLLYCVRDKDNCKASEFRSEKVQMRYEKQTSTVDFSDFETLFSQVRKEVEQEVVENELVSQSGEALCRNGKKASTSTKLLDAIHNGGFSSTQDEDITASFQNYLQNAYARKMERMQQLLAEKLKTSKSSTARCLLKVRVVDANHPKQSGIVTVWQPDDELKSILQEHTVLDVYNTNPAGIRSGELQINGVSSTRYNVLDKRKFSVPEELMRKIQEISLISKPEYKPVFNELDTVGMVVSIEDFIPKKFQSVYLADFEQNILCIKFWAGLQEYAYDDVVKVGNIILASNLQWRSDSSTYVIKRTFATNLSAFTENPKVIRIRDELVAFKSQFSALNVTEFIKNCQLTINKMKNELSKSLNTSLLSRSMSNLNDSVTNPNQQDTASRIRPTVQDRINKLLLYGAPPPISPINFRKRPLSSASKSFIHKELNTDQR